MTKAVAGYILRNPAHSMNNMAQEYNVSARTIGKVVKVTGHEAIQVQKIYQLNGATRVKRKADQSDSQMGRR
ncbi:Hypothetical protein FKW44_018484 [Caligus rogercresseyi]|uniref:Uncharacterized protein n=1 Tax=Caligus rogercresseyi TaxID=217165 RepID=A0A7T8GUK3_CALRO|nr:Hypothetical protein FKW44_018484 [Caligus rogercresseyi]